MDIYHCNTMGIDITKLEKLTKFSKKTGVIYLVLQYYLSIHFLMTVLTFRY